MLNFTLKQLRYVEAAGRLGSIAKAATEMSISQSSITAAIDALEQSLDYDIFVRTPAKGIQATPSGLETLHLIKGFLDQSRHFEGEIQSVGSDAAGLVRIGCYATAAPSFLPPILKAITEDLPGISITLLEGNMATILEFLTQGEADLVFTYNQGSGKERLDFLPLFEAPPYALIPSSDPAAEDDSISLAALAERPMVLLDLPMTRDYFLSMFEECGLHPNIVHTSRSSEICRSLVASGFGFSMLNILPPEKLEDDAPYRALRIQNSVNEPIFGIATLQGARQPKTVRAIIETCLRLKARNSFADITV